MLPSSFSTIWLLTPISFDQAALLLAGFAFPWPSWLPGRVRAVAEAPLDPARVRFEPSRDGRLLRALDADGGPPLRAVASGKRFALGLTLSRVEGAMRLVR